MLSHVAGPNNFLGQTEAKARYSLLQSLARIWLQQNGIHRSYLEELLGADLAKAAYWPIVNDLCRLNQITDGV